MRALLLVLDRVGIGQSPDAAEYRDEGANTLGHILEQVPELHGSDHTLEEVPLFLLDGGECRKLGTRKSFADVAASLAQWFGLEPWRGGESFLARS